MRSLLLGSFSAIGRVRAIFHLLVVWSGWTTLGVLWTTLGVYWTTFGVLVGGAFSSQLDSSDGHWKFSAISERRLLPFAGIFGTPIGGLECFPHRLRSKHFNDFFIPIW